MSASLRLIFRGQIATGSDPDQARRFLARRFRLDDAMATRVMSGRKVALARALTEADAFSLQSELEGAGIITRIERDPDAPPLTLAPHPEDTAAQNAGQPSEAPAPEPDYQHTPDPQPVAISSTPATCRQCQRQLSVSSSFCPWCGARQGSRLSRVITVSVALLLVLAAIGIPLYYTVAGIVQARTESHRHVASAMARAEDIQRQLTDFISRTSFWPNSNLDAGLPPPEALSDDSLSRITIGNQAMISLTFRDQLPGIGGHTLLFVPASDSGQLPRWECRGGTLPANWLPGECQPPEQSGETTPAPATRAAPEPPAAATGLPPANYLRRVLTQEFEQSAYIRDRMIAWHRRHGRWPDRHEVLDLADPLQLGSYAMRRVQVNAGGELLFEFSTALEGMEGRQLTLKAYDGGRRWQCHSDLPTTHLPVTCQP